MRIAAVDGWESDYEARRPSRSRPLRHRPAGKSPQTRIAPLRFHQLRRRHAWIGRATRTLTACRPSEDDRTNALARHLSGHPAGRHRNTRRSRIVLRGTERALWNPWSVSEYMDRYPERQKSAIQDKPLRRLRPAHHRAWAHDKAAGRRPQS